MLEVPGAFWRSGVERGKGILGPIPGTGNEYNYGNNRAMQEAKKLNLGKSIVKIKEEIFKETRRRGGLLV